MAIIRNSVFGSLSGKVGEGVSYKLNGQDILRALPSKRTGLSEKEKVNRLKFAASQKWLAPLIDFLRIGLKGYQPTYEGFVAAKSYNHKHALQVNEANEISINPALAMISYGTQPLPQTVSATCTTEHEIVVNWSKEGGYSSTDFALLLIYNAERSIVRGSIATTRRNAGTTKYTLKPTDIGLEFDLYLAFVSLDQKNRTNSLYLGKITAI